MTDLASWRDLETRFRALQPQDREKVFAEWVSIPFHEQGDQWSVRGADERVRTNFKWCAERAAAKLGHPGGSSAVCYWLDLLRRDSPHYRGGMEMVGDGAARSGGTIDHVCEASADYCLKLEALPALPRGAFQRIETAAREARERYERDKAPCFPLSEDFSFLEQDIFRAAGRILELLRLFTEQVLDAHLKEYLQSAPSEVAANQTLLEWVSGNVRTLAGDLWQGFGLALKYAPVLSQVPESEQWADFWRRMAEPDSELAKLNERYENSIGDAIKNRIEHYRKEAASRIAGEAQPAQGEPASVHAQQPESSGGGASSRQETATEAVTTKAPTERHRTRRPRRKKAAKRKAGKQGPKTNREKVKDFIARMAAAGIKITKKDIWTVAGYKSRRDFEQFQADKKATAAARHNFTRVLSMKPGAFSKLLQEKRAPVFPSPLSYD